MKGLNNHKEGQNVEKETVANKKAEYCYKKAGLDKLKVQ